jgi:hypothetical protein
VVSERDDDLIEQARVRKARGHTNALDEWRLRAAERREERTMTRNDNALDTDPNAAEAWNDWFDARFDTAMRDKWVDSFGEALGVKAAELRAEIERLSKTVEQLRVELAEQRGEMRAWRDVKAAKASKVIDLPKMNWRRDGSAA